MLGPFLAISVICGIAYYFAYNSDSTIIAQALNHSFLHEGACFAMGVFWARYWGRIPAKWWVPVIALAAYLAVKVLGEGPLVAALKPILIAVPLSVLVMYAGYYGPKLLRGWAARVGDLSFATYIWQYLIINIFLWWGFGGDWWDSLIVLAVTWVIAAGSWWGVEKHALKLKRISLRDRTSA
jgi:peptidoglycan/LPS O-acetylase OafA/YrhL